MKTIISSVLTIMLSSMSMGAFADNVTLGTKATASLVASCQIQAQSVSFGALALPISAQSATSNMNILCSKEAPYKIDLSYGLSTNYWTVTSGGFNYSKYRYETVARLMNSSGQQIDSKQVTYGSSGGAQAAMEQLTGCKVAADGKCYEAMSPTEISTASGNGNMAGSKGDNISYNISLPGDTSKIWNIGKNSYNATGVGTTQSIPIQAQIVPSGSTAYPTPDMYTDTVTATITY